MPINKAEILSLSAEEKIELAEELWSSVEEEFLPITEDELSFVKDRLQMHEADPGEGMSLEAFKKYFTDKYGF